MKSPDPAARGFEKAPRAGPMISSSQQIERDQVITSGPNHSQAPRNTSIEEDFIPVRHHDAMLEACNMMTVLVNPN